MTKYKPIEVAKQVTVYDLLIAKGINPDTMDFKDILDFIDEIELKYLYTSLI